MLAEKDGHATDNSFLIFGDLVCLGAAAFSCGGDSSS